MNKYGMTVVALALAGCASNVAIRYPAAPTDTRETGEVLVRFTQPVKAVSVSIDGLLVVEDKHTERIHIADVPAGSREIAIVAEAGSRAAAVEKNETVSVAAGQEASVLVAV